MHCHFCEIGKESSGLPFHDIPFMREGEYFAIPTVGALVPGWSLICSNEHSLSLRGFYEDPEFQKFAARVISATHAAYRRPVVFEHGAARCASLTGCGVNHGHLHVVPLGGSLLPLMSRDNRAWQEVSASELSEIPEDQEYLFYSEQIEATNPVGYVSLISTPSSQYFRRLVADFLGRREEFDYKTHPFLEEAFATSIELSRHAA